MSAAAEDLKRVQEAGAEAMRAAPDEQSFRVFAPHELWHAASDRQEWFWDGYLPAGNVTLLSGHGGVGKSILALALAACIAVGKPFLGQHTRQARVAFFSTEDERATIGRRLLAICRHLGIEVASLEGNLIVLDATTGDPTLYRNDALQPTPAFAALGQHVKDMNVDVLIVDNASDVFGGREIDRDQVQTFMRSMAGLVRQRGGAVLLLAHVDKGQARNGGGADSYSGSTAWNNSARSRIALIAVAEKREKTEKRGGVRIELQHQKSNYGPLHQTIYLQRLGDGVMQAIHRTPEAAEGEEPTVNTDQITNWFLSRVHEYAGQNEFVSTARNSRSNAAAMFEHEDGYPVGMKAGEATHLLRKAERDGLVSRQTRKDAHRNTLTYWEVTPAGLERIGAASSALSESSSVSGDSATALNADEALASSALSTRRGYIGGKEHAALNAQDAVPVPQPNGEEDLTRAVARTCAARPRRTGRRTAHREVQDSMGAC